MNIIGNAQANTELEIGALVIIDVREPAEYREGHIHGAINFPSTKYNRDHYSGFQKMKIALVCQSGSRAKTIGKNLLNDGFNQVFLLETQMQDIKNTKATKGWSIDRQFRFTLGVLLLLYLSLRNFTGYMIIIPVILGFGLTITALIDRCYMRMGIAMLPWNKGKKV